MEERRKGGATWFLKGDRDGFEKEVERLTGGKEGESSSFFGEGWRLMGGRCTDECECLWTERAGALGCGQGGEIHVCAAL